MGVLCALLGFLGASGHLGVGGPVPAGGPVSGASCAAVACASVSFAASGAFTAASASCAACAAVVAGSCASAAARAVRAPAGTSFRVVTVKYLAALASHYGGRVLTFDRPFASRCRDAVILPLRGGNCSVRGSYRWSRWLIVAGRRRCPRKGGSVGGIRGGLGRCLRCAPSGWLVYNIIYGPIWPELNKMAF